MLNIVKGFFLFGYLETIKTSRRVLITQYATYKLHM